MEEREGWWCQKDVAIVKLAMSVKKLGTAVVFSRWRGVRSKANNAAAPAWYLLARCIFKKYWHMYTKQYNKQWDIRKAEREREYVLPESHNSCLLLPPRKSIDLPNNSEQHFGNGGYRHVN